MIEITIEPFELDIEDENGNVIFKQYDGITMKLEHSLKAIAKWEMKWKKPYLTNSKKYEKTQDEILDYITCMSDEWIDPVYLTKFTVVEAKMLNEYMSDTATAATFKASAKGSRSSLSKTGEETTAETIYYEMIQLGIPFECENWNINRLLALIRYCAEKENPGKKMSQKDVISRNAMLNKARRARLGSLG